MPFDSTGFADPKVETQTERDLAILRRARGGIAQRELWCRKYMSLNGAHCALGWVYDAVGGHPGAAIALTDSALYPALPDEWRTVLDHKTARVTAFNDTVSHQEVVALFDRAIERLERQCLTE